MRRQDQTDPGAGFVHLAVGVDVGVGFADAAVVEERRLARVAGPR
jgi:hypothetical protein